MRKPWYNHICFVTFFPEYDEQFTQADYENESFMIKFFEMANIIFERTYNKNLLKRINTGFHGIWRIPGFFSA